jgi:hypothetical protein
MNHDEWLLRLKIDKMVAIESDKFYEQTETLGDIAAQAFKDNEAQKRNSQINGLKNICYSASRLSDIYDFIKRQTGRSKGEKWGFQGFGSDLLQKLQGLADRAKNIVENLGIVDKEEKLAWQRQIHILLCREYVKHLAAHFLYRL